MNGPIILGLNMKITPLESAAGGEGTVLACAHKIPEVRSTVTNMRNGSWGSGKLVLISSEDA